RGAHFDEQHARTAVRHGLPPQLAYESATRSPSSGIAMKRLGNGDANTVYDAWVTLPGGRPLRGVYKTENQLVPREAEAAGISKLHPTYGIRNVATYKLDQRLGLNLTPHTCLVLNGRELGCVMGFAP